MDVYADTNFLTRLYFETTPSGPCSRMLTGGLAEGLRPLPVSWLLRLELTNAFELSVFVSRKTGQIHITSEMAAVAQATFLADLENGSFLRRVDLPIQKVESMFVDLSLRHTARQGFRSYDLLHVASAFALGCDTFWSLDDRARKLAKIEGLKTN